MSLTVTASWAVLGMPGGAIMIDVEGALAELRFDSVSAFQIGFPGIDLATDLRTDGVVDNATRTALAWCRDHGWHLSPRYHWSDLASKGNGRSGTHRWLIRGLEAVSDALGDKVEIISGYRDPEHNAVVGGVPDSQHQLGTAADVDQLDFDAVRGVGIFSGIGCVGTWPGPVAHVDVRFHGPRNTTGGRPGNPTQWTY